MPARKTKPRSLKEYQAKRNFASTPEPKGNAKSGAKRSTKKKLSFCVQKHLASHLHYDFRLEHDGALLSWAVPKGPSLRPSDKRLAMRVEDHPLDYGDFEGVIPEGYGAGIVMLWDKGTWTPDRDFQDIDAALNEGELKFTLKGVKLKGSWALVRTRGYPGARTDESGQSRSWLLLKHRDEWAGDVDVAEFAPKSVKSNQDFPEILAQDTPKIWQSHRPAEGGAAGKLLQKIIDEAAQIKAKRMTRKNRRATKQGRSADAASKRTATARRS